VKLPAPETSKKDDVHSVSTSELVVVNITMKMGEMYRFPNMTRRGTERAIAESSARPMGVLVLVNIDGAFFAAPTRIVSEVAVSDGLSRP